MKISKTLHKLPNAYPGERVARWGPLTSPPLDKLIFLNLRVKCLWQKLDN